MSLVGYDSSRDSLCIILFCSTVHILDVRKPMRTSLFVIIGHVSHVQGKNEKLTQHRDGEIALSMKE